jgi:protein ImuA
MRGSLAELRRQLAALEPAVPRRAQAPFALGHAGIDRHLGGGLARGCLHEAHARSPRDCVAAAGFALALAGLAAGKGRLVWARHRLAGAELGVPYGPGLAAFGLDPDGLILVEARDPLGALRAAHEALRCAALGAVVIEIHGAAPALDLTASRRLAMTPARSGVTAILLRGAGQRNASAAQSRWIVAGAPSAPLAGDAPGHPVLDIELDRHRAGIPPARWLVEWNRDAYCFTEASPVSGAVAAIPDDRPAASPATRGILRRAG